MYMGRNCVEETETVWERQELNERVRGTVWERQELNERERNCLGETGT